jgi:hypothetical protein
MALRIWEEDVPQGTHSDRDDDHCQDTGAEYLFCPLVLLGPQTDAKDRRAAHPHQHADSDEDQKDWESHANPSQGIFGILDVHSDKEAVNHVVDRLYKHGDHGWEGSF